MTSSHLSLLEGILQSLSSPITEHEISLLSSLVGHDPLKDALDLVDKDQGMLPYALQSRFCWDR